MTYSAATKQYHNLYLSTFILSFTYPLSHFTLKFNMSVVEISSKEQFDKLLKSSTIVVADCKYSRRYPADPVLDSKTIALSLT